MSKALTQGRTTSEFGRPLGLRGAASIFRAVAGSRSNEPAFVVPIKQRFAFSGSGRARVASEPEVRSELIASIAAPLSMWPGSSPPSNPTMEMCTAAPSLIQSRSLQAMKMLPVSATRLSTSRLAPPRMACVATSPTARACLRSTISRAFSNQYVTRSASAGTRSR